MKKAFIAIIALFLVAGIMGKCRASTIPDEAPPKTYYFDLGEQIVHDVDAYFPLLQGLSIARAQDTVVIRVANFGGSLWVGAILFNSIQSSKAYVIMDVVAPSFSMGAMLACAGKEIRLHPYSMLMYHSGSTQQEGKVSEIQASLNASERLVRKMFAQCLRFGILTQEQINEILNGKDIYVFPEDLK